MKANRYIVRIWDSSRNEYYLEKVKAWTAADALTQVGFEVDAWNRLNPSVKKRVDCIVPDESEEESGG